MKKIFGFFVFIFIIIAFGAGVYFSKDVNKQIENFKKIDFGKLISEVKKQVNLSNPLNIGGKANDIILLQSKIIEETNLQRQQNGQLPVLVENEILNKVAIAKANDMFVKQYFEHISPDGLGPGELAQKYGYNYILEGENLILGNFESEKEVVQNWMNSPGHRANILNNRYTQIGVAIIKGFYKGQQAWIGVQEFGLPLSACSEPNLDFKNKIDFDKNQLEQMSIQIEASKKQIGNINSKNIVYKQMVEDYNQMVNQYNSLAQVVKEEIENYNNQVNIFNNCVAGK
jgi:hypothetical protein